MADPLWVLAAKERVAEDPQRIGVDVSILDMTLVERERLLNLLREAHGALDNLMTRVIVLDPTFRPTKWERWPTIVAVNEVLK